MGIMASTDQSTEEAKLVNSGWMYKKGRFVSGWKRRYFELFNDGKLYYYSDEKKRTKKTSKGVADLSIIIGLNIVDSKNFEVITPTRLWCFQCKFKSECDEWVEQMKLAENSYLCHDEDKPNKRDYLNLSKNLSILKLIAKIGHSNGETILYSDQIIKINPKQKQQTRILLLTNSALYDIKPNENNVYKKCQKRIPFDKIPCCILINNEQFQIDVFIYQTDSKNIKTIIKTLIRADIEIIYQREEDEKEFNADYFEQDKDGDTLNDVNTFEPIENTSSESQRKSIRGKSQKKEELNLEQYDQHSILDENDSENENKMHVEEEEKKEDIDDSSKKNKKKKRRRRFETKKLKVKDFTFLSVIGRGTFGKILLVNKKDDNKIFAMKILKKTQVIASGQEKNVNAEREVLKSIKHPFLMSLRYAFQTESKLYLVLDYYKGGELMFHLKRKRKFNEMEAKFILCQVLLAIGCLHSNDIVYRDLKPENILLDEFGNCCLCDFGLCKRLGFVESDKKSKKNKNKSTDTFCGTPEYLAPEIIKETAYGKNVDWWSLGILAFELTVGIVPFFSSSNTEMYKKITESPLLMHSCIVDDCQDLIKQLLQRDVTKRLGFVNDVQDIQQHKWFADIDWDKVYKKEIVPPYKPDIENESDATDMPCVEMKYQEQSIRGTFAEKPPSNEQELFRGFTFRGNEDTGGDFLQGGAISISRKTTNEATDIDSVANTPNATNEEYQFGQLNEANEEEEDAQDDDDDDDDDDEEK